MASIITNVSAMAALQTLRAIGTGLGEAQDRVSSGLRVASAADNAAYWSISTTMRSDNLAISAVGDALALGAAKVDTAYAGMEAVADVLAAFKARLVTAKEDSVDNRKVQEELEQLKAQVRSIAESASFGGQNWLSTDIDDIKDPDRDIRTVVSSFVRGDTGNVSVRKTDVHMGEIALFNVNGGGLLQADARKMKTLGGIRNFDTFMDNDGVIWSDTMNYNPGSAADIRYKFSGPLKFTDPSDAITFYITVDADDPSKVDPAHHPGQTTGPLVIDRTVLDAYNAGLNGVISSYDQYIDVLNYVLSRENTDAYAHYYYVWDSATKSTIREKDYIGIRTSESSGLDGSYVEISGFSSTVGDGGLYDTSAYGTRSSAMNIVFNEFTLHKDARYIDGAEVRFSFNINRDTAKSYSFDRAYVNELLGKDNGKVATVNEMVTLLESLLADDWPDLTIEATGGNMISLRTEKDVDRLQGSKTGIGFTGISVNIEPLSELNFEDIDIFRNPDMLSVYISYMELVSGDVISAASTLGALQSRIEMQSGFNNSLHDAIASGIGRLVDADMNEESTRLKALQTQQQLAIQSLQIANSAPETIVQLFR